MQLDNFSFFKHSVNKNGACSLIMITSYNAGLGGSLDNYMSIFNTKGWVTLFWAENIIISATGSITLQTWD